MTPSKHSDLVIQKCLQIILNEKQLKQALQLKYMYSLNTYHAIWQ